jgi:tight adherence protein C
VNGLLGFLCLGGLWSLVAAPMADGLVRRLAMRLPGQTAGLAPGGALVGDVVDRLRAATVHVDRVVGTITVRDQRKARHRDRAVTEQLPDVVDLLRLAAVAGLPVASAITVLEDRPGGPLGDALRTSASRLDRGATTAAVLAEVPAIAGPVARSLVEVLVDHDRYGTPLGPALDRLAVESRLRRRRQAEEAARRLPVILLFPLVLTVLPAFVLLAVVPLLIGSFSSLSL